MRLKIFFHGGVGAVTGANFLVETPNSKFLIDCGLVQGNHEMERKNNEPFPYNPKGVGHLFVTHAHMDHIGRIPKLVHDGFIGVIISTPETKDIAALSLEDAYKVILMKEKAGLAQITYEEKDIKKALDLWKTVPYEEKYKFADIEVELKDAGHIIGSTIFEFKIGDKKIAFTGDLGNSPSPLLPDCEQVTDADYIVMESVYGDRNHESKAERETKFKRIIKETIERGGEVIIPAFSIERTQVILSELDNMVEGGEIKNVPVFLDSPLASKVTEVYKKYQNRFNARAQEEIKKGNDIFNFPRLKVTTSQAESSNIENTSNPKIVLAGSGMSEGGRVRMHERQALPDPKSTILLVGYQPAGTLGRHLEEGLKKVEIDKEWIHVKAKIEKIEGYSAHADSEHLLEFVEKAADSKRLKKVFVVMGEPKSSIFLTQRIRDYIGVDAVYPEANRAYDIT